MYQYTLYIVLRLCRLNLVTKCSVWLLFTNPLFEVLPLNIMNKMYHAPHDMVTGVPQGTVLSRQLVLFLKHNYF